MEHEEDLSTLLRVSSEQIGIKLDPPHIKMFLEYLDHLLRWNRTINLTSITSREEIIIKHFVDSLAALRAESFTHEASLLDVGTGAGFPGIPLKIVRPDLLITLVEPAMKKVSFLRFIIGIMQFTGVCVYEGTIEQFSTEPRFRQSFDYIVARAVKHDVIANHCSYLLKSGGKAVFYLSKSISNESLRASLSISRTSSFELPKNLGKRVISVASLAG